jgi:two-component system, NtrC family, sensor histidine kinase PilS
MKTRPISVKSGLLLSLRLTTYILVSVIVIYWVRYPHLLSTPFIAYSLLTLSLPVLFILRKWMDTTFLFKAMHFIQILLEMTVVMGIIYITGNINSTFSALFILTIISTALVTNLAGTLGVASLISVAYAYVVWFGLSVYGVPGSSSKALEANFSSPDAAFYNIFLHVLTFFFVAFVSGFLVERLKSKDRELADASQALKLAKLETDDILRHINSGLLTIDKDGKIIFFNRAAREILGFDGAEARGRDFRDVFYGRMPDLAENLAEVLKTRMQKTRSEIEIIDREGRRIPLGISTSLLIDGNENIRGVIAIFQDLTETKQWEEKIRAADKMAAVGELSAAIAHEIRNPLAAISGSVEVLNGELEVADENRRLLELIVRESSRLNNILSDFLLFARSKRISFTRVELCHLVSDVVEVIRHHPSHRPDISIKVSAEESMVYIFGDEDQIKQILINLIVNACEAIGEKPGEIAISIKTDSDKPVELDIVDNGPGIGAEIIPKIFTPFFSTKKDGTGLGLAIVHRLAANLDIELSVQSEIGRGTAFILDFHRVPGNQFVMTIDERQSVLSV